MRFLLRSLIILIAVPLAQAQDSTTPSLVLFDDLQWGEVIPGVAFANAYGDWQTEAHGKFVRIESGTSVALHTHTNPFHGVMLSGSLTNEYEGEVSPAGMGPGTYWYVPGDVPHINTCLSSEPCVFYTHLPGALDVTFVD